jgi:D-sedoheptulose 7-phosphate isomerase
MSALDLSLVEQFADILYQAWARRACVFFFGNGGSALSASHCVTDLVKTAAVADLPRLKAYSLTDNVGMSTAVANDVAYDETFAYALDAYGTSGDVAVALSVSGTSPNVIKACRLARQRELVVVALTGHSGGAVGRLADLTISVLSSQVGNVEVVHLAVSQLVTQRLHERLLEYWSRGVERS